MIYQNKPRMRPEPTFGVFDCPDGSQSLARRNVSTTALQSLNLLNSAFMLQQSQLFAERLEREHPGDVDAQIARALRWPSRDRVEADELAAARQLVAEHGLAAVLPGDCSTPTSLFTFDSETKTKNCIQSGCANS